MAGAHDSDLRSAERRRAAAFLQAPIPAAVLDPSGRLLDTNPALRALLDLSAEAGTLDGHLHPEDRDRAAAAFRRLATWPQSAPTRELRMVRSDGKVLWTLTSAALTGAGDYVVQVVDISERREAEQRLAHAAVHDPLTGLPNRVLFHDRLSIAISMLERQPGLVGVFFLDLDGFKAVNDTLGHARGDELLVAVARRLRHGLRTADTLARMGGDEFALLIRDLQSEAQAVELVKRIVASIRPPVEIGGSQVSVAASIGVALTRGGNDPKELLRQADVAMYRAKAQPGTDWAHWRDQL